MTRADAVQYALCWDGTPYVTGGRVIHAGCDCATLLSEYIVGIGRTSEIPLFTYAQDWFCHTAEERYFNEVSKYAELVWEGRCIGTPAEARPGNLALFRANIASGPTPRYSHGCIVTEWPRALHAFHDRGVTEMRPALLPLTAHAEMAIFDPFTNDGDSPQ